MGLEPSSTSRGQPIVLLSALRFVGDGHFDQARFEGRNQVGFSEVLPMFQAQCFLYLASMDFSRHDSKQPLNLRGDLRGSLHLSRFSMHR